MIDVATPSIIQRGHLRDQILLREIAKRLGMSRNTLRRYLRADVTVPPPIHLGTVRGSWMTMPPSLLSGAGPRPTMGLHYHRY